MNPEEIITELLESHVRTLVLDGREFEHQYSQPLNKKPCNFESSRSVMNCFILEQPDGSLPEFPLPGKLGRFDCTEILTLIAPSLARTEKSRQEAGAMRKKF